MPQSILLSHPSQLDRDKQTHFLEELRKTLQNFLDQSTSEELGQNIRIRDWLFFTEEGHSVVDIILDRRDGLKSKPLSFTECLAVHKHMINLDLFNIFSDDVEIRCGTPGSEPPLRDEDDFKKNQGQMVRVITWQPISGRHKFTMILLEFFVKEGNSGILLGEGSHKYQILLEEIREAFTLPFHPASKSVKTGKSPK